MAHTCSRNSDVKPCVGCLTRCRDTELRSTRRQGPKPQSSGRNKGEQTVLTRQQMFNRAYLGLASQGFERCIDGDGCAYRKVSDDGTITHCAWGWVDPSLSKWVNGSVRTLRNRGIGVAANLSADDVRFAADLQSAHDLSYTPAAMRGRLIELALFYNLSVPEIPVTAATQGGHNG